MTDTRILNETVEVYVRPCKSLLGERWLAQVLVGGTSVCASSSQDIDYWPSFRARTSERAQAKAERWVERERQRVAGRLTRECDEKRRSQVVRVP